MGRSVWRIALILGVLAVTGTLLYFSPFNLGLDLRGGVHVVLEAQETGRPITAQDMNGALAIIERRVNALGVAEPVIQRQGAQRIIIQLPGIHDQQQAIDTIGKTALLEFKDPYGRTVLTGANLQSVQLGTDRFGRPAIDLEFDR
ncbi:MAG: preprotein translocase subunit SecD, partial [Limnochordia bacterium]